MRVATHNHQAGLGLLVAADIENVVQTRNVALEGVVDLGVCHFGGGRFLLFVTVNYDSCCKRRLSDAGV